MREAPDSASDGTPGRPTFGSSFGTIATLIGVAVGLGNVWRFPYMAGKFGGASFVLFYVLVVVLLGIPALMAEYALGRETRRGPVGAFAGAGLPGGRLVGWFFFFVVSMATGYYTNVIGWVLYYAAGEIAQSFGLSWASAAILPPAAGFDRRSLVLQMLCTALVIGACAWVLLKGLRAGIEATSKIIMPLLYAILIVLIVRSLTLPGSWAGLEWYILKFDPAALSPAAMVAALGQAFFSLSLGGTFMVVYGSYLATGESLRRVATWTALGDTVAGLLAGLAILPAVFALGLEPASGPGLIFFTLPKVFAAIPLGGLFGLLFFLALFGAAFLSDVAAFEVLIAGLTDNTRLPRSRAVGLLAGTVFLAALAPMINMKIFLPWDLTFGSGMQTLGSLLAVVAVAWCLQRSSALRQLATANPQNSVIRLYYWLRFVIPGGILLVGTWWLLTDVLGVIKS